MPESTLQHYRVIGNPIAHSRSPWIHAHFARQTGMPIQYEHCLAPLDGFAATVSRLQAEGVKGCNVTLPFKTQAAALATHPSARVRLAQAANTLHFAADGSIHADNTDGPGLVQDITLNAQFPIAGQRILMLGAGGAAAGTLASLIAAQPGAIHIVNRTAEKALALIQTHQALAQRHNVRLSAAALESLHMPAQSSAHTRAHAPTLMPTDGADRRYHLLINATATSLAGNGLNLPSPAQLLHPGAMVYDMMYGDAAHTFLDWATRTVPALGIQPRDGLGMLVEQAAESFAIWHGIRPDGAATLAALQQYLRKEGA